MARKKATPKRTTPKTKAPSTLPVTDTADLIADGANPRCITEEAADGLQNSLNRFGDLSGIVWNQRTGELVCGHQRVTQIREKWGDRPIAVLDGEAELGVIRIDEQHAFAVRVVDWTPAVQRAANVAANNQKVAGQFTDDLTDYLLTVEADLQEEAPGLLDDVLLTELLAEGMSTADAVEGVGGQATIAGAFEVIVACNNEEDQAKLYKRLKGDGYSVKVSTA